MSDTPAPTAATPEELAAKLDKAATWFDSDDQITFIVKDAAHLIRAQKLHTDRVDSKLVEQERQIEAQRAEIERLTKENARLGWGLAYAEEGRDDFKARATTAEAALAASLERERGMREALERIAKGETVVFDADDLETDVITTMDDEEMRDIARSALSAKEATDER